MPSSEIPSSEITVRGWRQLSAINQEDIRKKLADKDNPAFVVEMLTDPTIADAVQSAITPNQPQLPLADDWQIRQTYQNDAQRRKAHLS